MATVTGRVIHKGTDTFRVALYLIPGAPAFEASARASACRPHSPLSKMVASQASGNIDVVVEPRDGKPIPTAIVDGGKLIPLFTHQEDTR